MKNEKYAKILKVILFIPIFIIFLCGAAVLSAGTWTLLDRSAIEKLLETKQYTTAAEILIATGTVVILVTFLGFYGAIINRRTLLITFLCLLFPLFVVMLIGGIMNYKFLSEIEKKMLLELPQSIKLYGKEKIIQETWDLVQTTFKCCGLKTPDEDEDHGWHVWKDTNPEEFSKSRKVPESCCKSKTDENLAACYKRPNETNAYLADCHEKLEDFFKKHSLLLANLGIGLSFVLLWSAAICIFLLICIGTVTETIRSVVQGSNRGKKNSVKRSVPTLVV